MKSLRGLRRSSLILAAAALLLAFSTEARAQFGMPAQKPGVDPQGTLLFYPTIGVVHDGDAGFRSQQNSDPWSANNKGGNGGFTDAALTARLSYSILDEASVDAKVGGILGDFDALVLGFGGKVQFVKRDRTLPIDFSAFTSVDLALGNATALTWLLGPIVSGTIDAGPVEVTPYGGLGVGLTYLRPEGSGGDHVDAALGFLLGGDVAFSRYLSAFTEIMIGATDGLPIVNWQIGLSYALVASLAPRSDQAE